MDAYLIIGDANTRKSSVLRSLTGCFNRSTRDIKLLTGGVIKIYARVSSLQESETEPGVFITEATRRGCPNVVFCLWPHANPKDPALYPGANDYIGACQKAGWNFLATAVLGSHVIAPATINVGRFPHAPTQEINITAQAVRQHFGWQ